MSQLISYGGGVNSTAMILLLFSQGKHYPIVYAETGIEKPQTDEYIPYFENYLKKKYGEKIEKISPRTHIHLYGERIRKNNIIDVTDYCEKIYTVPKFPSRWCTSYFKRDPIMRWGKEKNIFIHAIGYAADESHRAKYPTGKYSHSYPLIEEDITRQGCVDIIESAGLYVPEKSGCYICPFQRDIEWRKLYKNHAETWTEAKLIESKVSKAIGRKVTIHNSGYSLQEYEDGWKTENPLFPDFNEQNYSDKQCPYCNL